MNLYDDNKEKKDQETRWKLIKSFITGCKNQLLFFVDDFSNETDPDFQWLTDANIHLFITSRLSKVRKFEKNEINPLDKDQSIDLFYCYYDYDNNHEEKETVTQLVNLVSRYTLSIELLAGIANGSTYSERLKQFLDDLQKNGFGFPDLKTLTSYSKNKKLTIPEHLTKLFKIADLNNEQYRILANFRITPKGLQLPRKFSAWIKSDDTALTGLVNSRWISLSKNGYLMYDIVWEAVKLQLTNIPYEYAENMIKTVMSKDYFDYKEEHLLSTKKLQIAEAYAKYFSDRDTVEWSNFLNVLGMKYDDKGEYDKARGYYERALDVCEKKLGKGHPTCRGIQGNLDLLSKH